MPLTCSVFIGVSLDGFIARENGDLEWLISRGEAAGDDLGFQKFIAGIDTIVTGRGTYEAGLGFETWPYEGLRVAVLSRELDADADPRITVYRDLDALLRGLADSGAEHVYVDGGQVIQTFLREGLIDDMTITTVPVLLGSGRPLFGPLNGDVSLVHRATQVFGASVVQTSYDVVRTAG
ncbi:dihydrofolate reductase [Nonomuraea sp. NN258]|uniref:dihydrofolate reductase family protein n=1 Tax=Nonomuraea antri TaxID=2730852 RepID=UPI001568C486|nr:dihydrofolate reductase family protein [Nonomuraea antri]NRQ40535.1 dihydrofolate reductase [Nonomuraea antri]